MWCATLLSQCLTSPTTTLSSVIFVSDPLIMYDAPIDIIINPLIWAFGKMVILALCDFLNTNSNYITPIVPKYLFQVHVYFLLWVSLFPTQWLGQNQGWCALNQAVWNVWTVDPNALESINTFLPSIQFTSQYNYRAMYWIYDAFENGWWECHKYLIALETVFYADRCSRFARASIWHRTLSLVQ